MQLKAYPRLNLPTKRMGMEISDWLALLGSVLPGVLLVTFNGWVGLVFLIVFPGAVLIWARTIKPTKPQGWLMYASDYFFRQGRGEHIIFQAELEDNADRSRLS